MTIFQPQIIWFLIEIFTQIPEINMEAFAVYRNQTLHMEAEIYSLGVVCADLILFCWPSIQNTYSSLTHEKHMFL